MSYLLMGAVCEADQMQVDRGLLPSDRHVLLRLANRVNTGSGLCCPGHAKLAEDTGLSVRTIGDATQALWRGGFIDWTERWIEGSVEQGTNLYRIHCADHADATPDKPRLILTPKEPRTGNRPRQERPPIQVIAIPRHRKLKKKDTEVGGGVQQPLQYPPAESALPPCSSRTTPLQPLHDPTAADAEKPGLNQELKREGKQEGIRVVVVGAAPTKKGFFFSYPLNVLEEQGEQGNEPVKSEDEYVEDGSGSLTAHRDSSDPSLNSESQRHHPSPNQDTPDSINGDDALGEEYLPLDNIPPRSTEVFPQPPKAIPVQSTEKSSPSVTAAAAPRPLAPADPFDASFKPAVKSQPLGSQEDALVLVQHFLDLVQPTWACSDAHRHRPDWIRTARLMLGVNSLTTLTWAITYAMKIKFWRDALQQKGRDPFAFFEDRISSGGEKSLLAQSINSQPSKKMESSHGKKTANPAATGRSGSSADKARTIAEQAKRAGRR